MPTDCPRKQECGSSAGHRGERDRGNGSFCPARAPVVRTRSRPSRRAPTWAETGSGSRWQRSTLSGTDGYRANRRSPAGYGGPWRPQGNARTGDAPPLRPSRAHPLVGLFAGIDGPELGPIALATAPSAGQDRASSPIKTRGLRTRIGQPLEPARPYNAIGAIERQRRNVALYGDRWHSMASQPSGSNDTSDGRNTLFSGMNIGIRGLSVPIEPGRHACRYARPRARTRVNLPRLVFQG
jgi:hypothetical protein